MYINEDTELYAEYYKTLADHKQIPQFYKTYLGHVLKHKDLVFIAWRYIGDILHELKYITFKDMESIEYLIRNHDNSKLYKDEFIPYAKRFNGPKKSDPKIKMDFKEAVKLHKERNIHHYENLKTYKGRKLKQYAVELICDYIAMGWEFDNYICEYFQKVKEELKNDLPCEYYNYIESIINIIPEKLPLAEEPLTENNMGYIYHVYNDPFNYEDLAEDHNIKEIQHVR